MRNFQRQDRTGKLLLGIPSKYIDDLRGESLEGHFRNARSTADEM
jgi:hypothetical protein